MSSEYSSDWVTVTEARLQRKFGHYGPEVLLVLERVFKRYGNFKPLLQHLSLICTGDLEEQQHVLQRCLSQHGTAMFLEAIETGVSPTSLATSRGIVVEKDPSGAFVSIVAEPSDPAPGPSLAPMHRYDPTRNAERRRRHDRRSKKPGRRQKLDLLYPESRRKGSCRRRGPRRSGDF